MGRSSCGNSMFNRKDRFQLKEGRGVKRNIQ